jgi:hypothetical protein
MLSSGLESWRHSGRFVAEIGFTSFLPTYIKCPNTNTNTNTNITMLANLDAILVHNNGII